MLRWPRLSSSSASPNDHHRRPMASPPSTQKDPPKQTYLKDQKMHSMALTTRFLTLRSTLALWWLLCGLLLSTARLRLKKREWQQQHQVGEEREKEGKRLPNRELVFLPSFLFLTPLFLLLISLLCHLTSFSCQTLNIFFSLSLTHLLFLESSARAKKEYANNNGYLGWIFKVIWNSRKDANIEFYIYCTVHEYRDRYIYHFSYTVYGTCFTPKLLSYLPQIYWYKKELSVPFLFGMAWKVPSMAITIACGLQYLRT